MSNLVIYLLRAEYITLAIIRRFSLLDDFIKENRERTARMATTSKPLLNHKDNRTPYKIKMNNNFLYTRIAE